MDFNSALANLQRTANAVKNNNNNNGDDRNRSPPRGGGSGGGGGGGFGFDRGGGGGGFDRRRRREYPHQYGGGSGDRGRGGMEVGGDRGGRPAQRPRIDNQHHHYSSSRFGGGYYASSPDRSLPSSLLDPLRRFGYRVDTFQPSPPPVVGAEERAKKSRHLCLLALTIEDLPYEHIWRAWATGSITTNTGEEDVDNVYVSLVGHAKYPSQVKSEWFKRLLLTRPPKMGRGNSYAPPEYFTHIPEWGSVQLTRAMIDTLAQGLTIGTTSTCSSSSNTSETTAATQVPDERFSPNRHVIRQPEITNATTDGDGEKNSKSTTTPIIPPVDAFVFISETCLPVRSLDECLGEIFGGTATTSSTTATREEVVHSWVMARNRNTPGTPRNKYERDQFAEISRMVPGQYRWKADQWILLSRDHAMAILGIDRPHMVTKPRDQLWCTCFGKISASDEMYFPTTMALLGILHEQADKDQQVVRKQVTYVDWSEGMRNPATYTKGVRDLIRIAKLARQNGSLFARKFAPVALGSVVSAQQQQQHVPITGAISVQEWTDAVERVASEAAAATSAAALENDNIATAPAAAAPPPSLADSSQAGDSGSAPGGEQVITESEGTVGGPANAKSLAQEGNLEGLESSS